MHIPDGYLSPSTCIGLYAAATPFWYVAMKRLRTKLATQAVPLLALLSAFSFVLMMFNLPLPGGTSGHAVGMGIASIVLGPWMSILSVSVALLVQAVFFGDGGITAYGANCFNMAVVGSLVAYGVYKVGSFRAGVSSVRRVLAAGLAGYSGINVAALLAAIEFGIQPVFFHDVNGIPLYAPYPLSVSIPAMMIGHLTFAGMAEFLVTAALLKYLAHADPALLEVGIGRSTAPSLASRRKLWVLVLIAVCLTPLGILTIGKAWGEWKVEDFADPAGRTAIAASSGNAAVPSRPPAGLEHLSSLWRAPLGDYELRLIRNSSGAYFVCAALGVGLAITIASLITRLGSRRSAVEGRAESSGTNGEPKRTRSNFLEKAIDGLLSSMRDAFVAEELARSPGLLQSIDPRAKLLGLVALVLASVFIHRLTVLFALFAAGVLIAGLSRISPAFLLKRIWLPVLAFTGLVAAPALFTVPGEPIGHLPALRWAVSFSGLMSAVILVVRAETASTFSLLLVLCTPWNQLLRALRFCKVPVTAVVILQMTHRYVFLLVETAGQMLEARRARLVGYLGRGEQHHILAASAGVLLDKTLHLGRDVHSAMQARGYRGEVFLLDDPELCLRDRAFLAGFVSLAGLLCWLGR
jgi:cobalt/nickel transport system permease protein